VTGKPDAVKVARPVWSGGKTARSYLVRHLTFVQIALKELHHDNGVRVEQPALPFGKG